MRILKNISSTQNRADIFDKARNFYEAIRREIASGSKLATKEKRLYRKKICDDCPLWRPSGNLWLGECTHKKCGCTKFKRFFSSEHCPQNKW